jgi:hypothetical protein
MIRINEKDNNNNSNKKTNDYDNNNINKKLIDYLYTSVDISKYNYEILKYENELEQLLTQKYYVSVNFSGNNSLLIFNKIKDKFYSYLIDRTTLSYKHNKIDYQKVKVINISLSLDPSIYTGTIFSGIYFKSKTENIFIISDVFMFKGNDLTNIDLSFKLHLVSTYLKSNYDETTKTNSIVLTINKLYNLNEIENLIEKVIPNIKGIAFKGICFYPELSGKKLIYLFSNNTNNNSNNTNNNSNNINNSNIKNINNINNNNNKNSINNTNICKSLNDKKTNTNDDNNDNNSNKNDTIQTKKQTKTIYKPLKNKKYVLEMKKTNNPDVYFLRCLKPILDETTNKKILKRQSIGLAYIPNIKISAMCKELYENTNNDIICVLCEFNENNNGWTPLELSKERPSLETEFEIIEIE